MACVAGDSLLEGMGYRGWGQGFRGITWQYGVKLSTYTTYNSAVLLLGTCPERLSETMKGMWAKTLTVMMLVVGGESITCSPLRVWVGNSLHTCRNWNGSDVHRGASMGL